MPYRSDVWGSVPNYWKRLTSASDTGHEPRTTRRPDTHLEVAKILRRVITRPVVQKFERQRALAEAGLALDQNAPRPTAGESRLPRLTDKTKTAPGTVTAMNGVALLLR